MKTIQEFAAAYSSKQPNSDIVSRWESRVVPNGLHLRGRAGAENYLARWGKGIRPDKALGLAAIARIKGCDEMAARFMEEAYFLETGIRDRLNTTGELKHEAPRISARPLREPFGAEPQLPTAITLQEAGPLLSDPSWGVQEKHDGTRAMFRVRCDENGQGVVESGNKLGLTRTVPLNISEGLALLPPTELDGEVVGTTVFLFDLLSLRGRDLRHLAYESRHQMLAEIVEEAYTHHPEIAQFIKVTPFIYDDEDLKQLFVLELEQRRAEGFILKQRSATYQPGDSTTQLKCQFRRSAAVIAGDKNRGKNSITIYVYRPDGSKREMGSLSVKASQPFPRPGSVIEVKYLYVHPGPTGKFAQPEFLGLRDDVNPHDCTDAKLQIKAAA